jgi:PPOX class probable F420-dependent enzyme
MLGFVAGNRRGVLATVKRDGRPQLSNHFYDWDDNQQLARISVTADRAKTRNLQADPRATLHVTSSDFWTWVAVEGTAELTPVATDPHTQPSRSSWPTTAPSAASTTTGTPTARPWSPTAASSSGCGPSAPTARCAAERAPAPGPCRPRPVAPWRDPASRRAWGRGSFG